MVYAPASPRRKGFSPWVLLVVPQAAFDCTPVCSDHWRKNLPVVGQSARAVSIDLLGYGYSDKPDPRDFPTNSLYCFETWGAQLLDFIDWRFGGEPAFIITNSVGGACKFGLAALDAALPGLPWVHAPGQQSHGQVITEMRILLMATR
jgi:hypothetical protein